MHPVVMLFFQYFAEYLFTDEDGFEYSDKKNPYKT
jgi:hypothetical protein